MKFRYQARTKEGELKTGIIEASTKEIALDLLQKLGLFVTYLEEEKPPFFARKIKFREKISQRDLVLFARQLAVLFNAGIPLVEALWTAAAQIKSLDFKEKIIKIAEEVEGGSPLSSALSKYPKVFSPFFVNLVKSGEMAGKLPLCLNQLADYLERNYNFREKLISSLTYPAIVLILFFGIFIFLIFAVFPNFQKLFSESGLELPLPTKIILSLSFFLQKYFLFFLLFILFLLAIFFWFLSQEKGKKSFDRFLLRLPILGPFLKEIYLIQIAQALQTLVTGGIHLTMALETVADLVGNSVYREAILEIKEKVKEGIQLSFLLHLYPDLFPPFFIQMITTGEKSGTLEMVLTNLVSFQQNETERKLERFLRILEPLLIISIASLVGFLVASVIIPLYRLITAY
jgi:type IV pilus assembly protein PilC